MLSFKKFLILEDIAQDVEAHGDVMYPTTAGDYAFAIDDPTEFWWLQWRWKHDKKLGRKFYNIDDEAIQKIPYVTLESPDMPEGGEGSWKNRPDRNSAQKIKTVKTLKFKVFGKTSKDMKLVKRQGYYSVDGNLEYYFKDNPSGKWPEEAPDTDWTKP